MKTSRRGFIAPLLLAFIAVLLIGGGAYVYWQESLPRESPPLPAPQGTTVAGSVYNSVRIRDATELFFTDMNGKAWTVNNLALTALSYIFK